MTTAADTALPIDEGLFTWPAGENEPQLIASRCTECSEVTFPRQDGCPSCTGRETEDILLSRRGRLWTWTIQRFPPPPPYIGPADPESFEAYGVGYVELPEGVRVEARLTENDPKKLEIGMDMELVVEKFAEGGQGREYLTFAFQPV